MVFELDDRLKADCYRLGTCDDNILLLSKNALFPWFILVPNTDETEYHKLSSSQQASTQQQINAIAQFIEQNFSTDKINIASIGNIVSQLHVHIIGRSKEDACWPNVVWGTAHFKNYESNAVAIIRNQLEKSPLNFTAESPN